MKNIKHQCDRVAKHLKIEYPIISAPMGNISGGQLASAVTRAGGLGLIGGGYCDRNWIKCELEKAEPGLFGIGFITWRLKEFPKVLDLAIEHQPRAIMLSFGDITPFVDAIKTAGIPLICQVQSVAQARRVKEQGADIIVAQGSEAGGHGVAGQSTLTLVPAVVDTAGDTPVLAAGGISDARGFTASLHLGAQGVLMGTRFFASSEALATDAVKQKLVSGIGRDTVRTTVFDLVRGYHWPKPYDAKVIKNKFTEKWKHEKNLLAKIDSTAKADYQKAVDESDFEMAMICAGEGLDLIHEVLPVQRIVEDIISLEHL